MTDVADVAAVKTLKRLGTPGIPRVLQMLLMRARYINPVWEREGQKTIYLYPRTQATFATSAECLGFKGKTAKPDQLHLQHQECRR